LVNNVIPDQFFKDILKTKKVVFHNHGGFNLLYPEPQIKQIEAKVGHSVPYIACSPLTIDVVSNAIWLPNIIPVHEPEYMPIPRDFNSTMLICQKVFSKQAGIYKGAEVVEEMITVFLQRKWGFNMSYHFWHDLPVREVLNGTAKYHVCIDNTTQGFIGLAGWESLAKGQVVIARLDPKVEKAYKEFGDGTCPIINVSGIDQLCKVLRELCGDRKLLEQKCLESRMWMLQYYKPERVVQMYLKIYKNEM
jgi:hypothetical protein